METRRINWRGIGIEISFTPQRFGMADHVELRSDGNALLPVTETGYRSHFVPVGAVVEFGGAVAFVTAWLDHEAARIGWSGAQLALF